MRLRYEIRREIAPYVGLEWAKYYGNSAGFIRQRDGLEVSDTKVVAGSAGVVLTATVLSV